MSDSGIPNAPDRTGAGRRPSRRGLAAISVIVALVLVEGAARVSTPVLNRVMTFPVLDRQALLARHVTGLEDLLEGEHRETLHPVYGWAYRPGWAHGADTIDAKGTRRSSAAGDRGALRLLAFGGSFVYCNEVSNAECWTAVLEERWDAVAVNYGVGGYGTDQALLRYLGEGGVDHGVVVIGYSSVNIRRVVNRYRGFMSSAEGPWFKPRFLPDGDGLRLVEAPVPDERAARAFLSDPRAALMEIGQEDYWYEPSRYEHRAYAWSAAYRLTSEAVGRVRRRWLDADRPFDGALVNEESEAFEVQSRLLAAFADSVRGRGASPVLLFMPSPADLARRQRGEEVSYAPLLVRMQDRGEVVLDVSPRLAAHREPSALLAQYGHYSPKGNALVAEAIAELLRLHPRAPPPDATPPAAQGAAGGGDPPS